jgi:hypothetical protein
MTVPVPMRRTAHTRLLRVKSVKLKRLMFREMKKPRSTKKTTA